MVEGPLPEGMKVICRMILGCGENLRRMFCDKCNMFPFLPVEMFAGQCPSGWFKKGSRCFLMVTSKKNWSNAAVRHNDRI